MFGGPSRLRLEGAKIRSKTTVPKRHVGKERAQTDASMTFAQVADG